MVGKKSVKHICWPGELLAAEVDTEKGQIRGIRIIHKSYTLPDLIL